MDKTIHIQGYAKDIDLLDQLSDNYNFPDDGFEYAEEQTETIPGMFFRFYSCPQECTLDQAIKQNLTEYFGEAEATGELTGYSEVTIEGFNVSSLKLGGHDLAEIIKSQGDTYLHILIDFVKVA